MNQFKRNFLILTLYSSVLSAGVINIPADIDSIQGGINSANPGDTVLVHPGTYIENINFNGKNIVVGSLTLLTGDTSYISQTVIDGNQNGSVVTFINGKDSLSVLCGFTLTNGSGWGPPQVVGRGGGIYLSDYSSPRLLNLIITGNVAFGANGAGICCWDYCNPLIENVIIRRNDGLGEHGTNDGSAGILLWNSSPILKNVEIVDNIGIMAGALFCHGNSNPVIINVTMANNIAKGSMAWDTVAELVAWEGANPILINTIIWNDSLPAILLRDYSSITAAYSDIQNGLDGVISFNEGSIFWLEGNLESYPQFTDPYSGNYRLSPESPCIDAGIEDTFLQISGFNALYIPPLSYSGYAPDMGAYEYTDPSYIYEPDELPNQYTLIQNYPNPFNPFTTIEFSLPETKFVELKVFNTLGKEVANMVSQTLNAGKHTYSWDATGLASGVYYYRLEAGKIVQTRKMIYLK